MQKKGIRVLHVFGFLNYGGAETMIMNMYRTLDRNKVQFDFVVHSDKPGAYESEIRDLGGLVFRVPRYRGLNHFAYTAWWSEFFKAHPEYAIVHSHIRSTASIILAIAKRHGRTTILHSHSTSNGSGIKAAIKRIYQIDITKNADYLFSCSDDAGKWLFGVNAILGENYHIVRNAIDIEAFSYNTVERMRIRAEFKLHENEFVIGTVGRISEVKNPYGIIEIFRGVCEKVPDARLLWVGTGDLEPVIRRFVENSEIRDKVVFTGIRADIPGLLSAMDVFLFPSLWEGLGMAVVEAQASGLPCLVSDRIPGEACVTPLVRRIPVSDTQQWISAVLTAKEERRRKNYSAEIQTAGYDISETAAWLQAFYLQNS